MESQRVQFPETKIPKFLSELIKYLCAKGLQEEGIFRQSGNQTTILEYKEKLDRGKGVRKLTCRRTSVTSEREQPS